MYDHKLHSIGPGTDWDSLNQKILIAPHQTTLNNLFSPNNYHLYVKSGYARAHLQDSPDREFWSHLYDKMQIARIGISKRKKFDGLLDAFSKFGFDPKHPIPVSTNYQILDGSHRVAAAFAHGVNPCVEIYANPPHSYSRSWFESVNFTQSELAAIDAVKNEITDTRIFVNSLSIGVVWGCALEYWDEIFYMFDNSHLVTAFCVELGNHLEAMAFTTKSYSGDGMKLERIIDKSERLANLSTKVGIFALQNMQHAEIYGIKKKIRNSVSIKMKNYFFDNIIHFIDCPQTAQSLFTKYASRLPGLEPRLA